MLFRLLIKHDKRTVQLFRFVDTIVKVGEMRK